MSSISRAFHVVLCIIRYLPEHIHKHTAPPSGDRQKTSHPWYSSYKLEAPGLREEKSRGRKRKQESKKKKKKLKRSEMCHLCVNFHNKSTIHTIEQVSTGDGHIELNQVRITPEEAEKDKAQTKEYEMQSKEIKKINMNSLILKGVIPKSVTSQKTCRWKP